MSEDARQKLVQALMEQRQPSGWEPYPDFRQSDNIDDRRSNNVLLEYLSSLFPNQEMMRASIAHPLTPLIPKITPDAVNTPELGSESIVGSGPIDWTNTKILPMRNPYQKR